MTPPIVHPLDVSFVLAVSAVSMVSGNVIGAALALLVAAGYFGLNAYLERKAGE